MKVQNEKPQLAPRVGGLRASRLQFKGLRVAAGLGGSSIAMPSVGFTWRRCLAMLLDMKGSGPTDDDDGYCW